MVWDFYKTQNVTAEKITFPGKKHWVKPFAGKKLVLSSSSSSSSGGVPSTLQLQLSGELIVNGGHNLNMSIVVNGEVMQKFRNVTCQKNWAAQCILQVVGGGGGGGGGEKRIEITTEFETNLEGKCGTVSKCLPCGGNSGKWVQVEVLLSARYAGVFTCNFAMAEGFIPQTHPRKQKNNCGCGAHRRKEKEERKGQAEEGKDVVRGLDAAHMAEYNQNQVVPITVSAVPSSVVLDPLPPFVLDKNTCGIVKLGGSFNFKRKNTLLQLQLDFGASYGGVSPIMSFALFSQAQEEEGRVVVLSDEDGDPPSPVWEIYVYWSMARDSKAIVLNGHLFSSGSLGVTQNVNVQLAVPYQPTPLLFPTTCDVLMCCTSDPDVTLDLLVEDVFYGEEEAPPLSLPTSNASRKPSKQNQSLALLVVSPTPPQTVTVLPNSLISLPIVNFNNNNGRSMRRIGTFTFRGIPNRKITMSFSLGGTVYKNNPRPLGPSGDELSLEVTFNLDNFGGRRSNRIRFLLLQTGQESLALGAGDPRRNRTRAWSMGVDLAFEMGDFIPTGNGHYTQRRSERISVGLFHLQTVTTPRRFGTEPAVRERPSTFNRPLLAASVDLILTKQSDANASRIDVNSCSMSAVLTRV